MSDLDDILSDEPIEEVAEEATDQPEAEEVGKPEVQAEPEQPAEPVAAKPEDDPKDKQIAGLTAALSEVRGELRAFKQTQQPQAEPQPAPDFYEDPQGAMQHQMAPVQAQVADFRLDMSEEMTVTMLDMQNREDGKTGRQIVDDAIEALRSSQNSAAYQEIMSQKNPYMALVKWHQQHQVAQEIGNDPEGWKERERAAIRAEIEQELKANQVAEDVVKVGNAPSLANEPNLGSRAAPAWGGPTSLDDILGNG